jgi:hypothetical protein
MRAMVVDTVIRRHAGQVAVHIIPPSGIDLQFIYRAALSIHWDPAEAILEDRCRAVESSAASAARVSRALRDEYGMVLRLLANVQWTGFSADERSQVASALFE